MKNLKYQIQEKKEVLEINKEVDHQRVPAGANTSRVL